MERVGDMCEWVDGTEMVRGGVDGMCNGNIVSLQKMMICFVTAFPQRHWMLSNSCKNVRIIKQQFWTILL
ncbi:MAG: hypothetical protein RSD76_08350, partial [Clostridia bacterium]